MRNIFAAGLLLAVACNGAIHDGGGDDGRGDDAASLSTEGGGDVAGGQSTESGGGATGGLGAEAGGDAAGGLSTEGGGGATGGPGAEDGGADASGLSIEGGESGADGLTTDGGENDSGVTSGVGADAAAVIPPIREAGAHFDANGNAQDSGQGGLTVAAFDGTSGKPCSSNADCGTTGINVCSNSYSGKLDMLNGVASPQFWPTPLCMVPLPTMAGAGNCDPGDPGALQFCDSADPNDPTSPGICLALTTPQQVGAGNGFCLPHCSFATDGSPPVGCPGKDTCVPLTLLFDPNTNAVSGHGYCQGTCQVDSDCSALGAGWVCQTDEGVCTKTKKARTKAIGTSCSNSGNGATPIATSDTETGACNCPYSGTPTTAFYCTSACVVGGAPCANGYVCDALVAGAPLTFAGSASDGGDLVLPGPTMQNSGLAGMCLAACTKADAGVVDAGLFCPGSSSVPPLSTCTAPAEPGGTVAGADCLP